MNLTYKGGPGLIILSIMALLLSCVKISNAQKTNSFVNPEKLPFAIYTDSTQELNSIDSQFVTVNGIHIGDPIKYLTKKFGPPDSYDKGYDPDEDKDSFLVISYKKSFFTSESNCGKISSFSVHDRRFLLFNIIKVGDNIAFVETHFPLSFKNRYTEDSISYIIIGFRNWCYFIPASECPYLMIQYNTTDNKIVSFYICKDRYY